MDSIIVCLLHLLAEPTLALAHCLQSNEYVAQLKLAYKVAAVTMSLAVSILCRLHYLMAEQVRLMTLHLQSPHQMVKLLTLLLLLGCIQLRWRAPQEILFL